MAGEQPTMRGYLPWVVAHRGASIEAPENTLAAFQRAISRGAAAIELDVKLSLDNIPVVIHDDTLERTTSGHGRVNEFGASALAELDAGSWFSPGFSEERIPTLEAALQVIAGRAGLVLELKPNIGEDRLTAETALPELFRLWPEDAQAPVVSSFSEESLETAMNLLGDWPAALNLDGKKAPDAEKLAALRDRGIAALHVDQAMITPAAVDAMLEAGFGLGVYTVNDPAEVKRLLGLGVDAVFTDDPGTVLDFLAP